MKSAARSMTLLIVVAAIIISIAYLEMQKPKISALRSSNSVIELPDIAGWINSEPINVSDLKGKVILIDFWDYSCINCIRTFPYLNAWYDKYHDKGLVIIGVHTPEFNFEKNYDNVLAATKKYGIKYPVALDNSYATWDAFGNQYWPREYLIDKDGNLVYDHIGEGGYDETEKNIQILLEQAGSNVSVGLVNIKDQTPTTDNTPEIYAGYLFALQRGQTIGNAEKLQPDIDYNYTLDDSKIQNDIIYLEGIWRADREDITKAGNDTSSVYLKFTAKSANIVAGPNMLQNSTQGAIVYVYIDGNYITKGVAGDDIEFDRETAFMTIKESRLYNIYKGSYATHTLKLSADNPAFAFNSFTFG